MYTRVGERRVEETFHASEGWSANYQMRQCICDFSCIQGEDASVTYRKDQEIDVRLVQLSTSNYFSSGEILICNLAILGKIRRNGLDLRKTLVSF